jgi:hypothetical protein
VGTIDDARIVWWTFAILATLTVALPAVILVAILFFGGPRYRPDFVAWLRRCSSRRRR